MCKPRFFAAPPDALGSLVLCSGVAGCAPPSPPCAGARSALCPTARRETPFDLHESSQPGWLTCALAPAMRDTRARCSSAQAVCFCTRGFSVSAAFAWCSVLVLLGTRAGCCAAVLAQNKDGGSAQSARHTPAPSERTTTLAAWVDASHGTREEGLSPLAALDDVGSSSSVTSAPLLQRTRRADCHSHNGHNGEKCLCLDGCSGQSGMQGARAIHGVDRERARCEAAVLGRESGAESITCAIGGRSGAWGVLVGAPVKASCVAESLSFAAQECTCCATATRTPVLCARAKLLYVTTTPGNGARAVVLRKLN